jgi:hypothetical protein
LEEGEHMRAPISVGDIVKMKGSKKVKTAPVGIVIKTFPKEPNFVSAECIVEWFDDYLNERLFTSQLSRITLDHV